MQVMQTLMRNTPPDALSPVLNEAMQHVCCVNTCRGDDLDIMRDEEHRCVKLSGLPLTVTADDLVHLLDAMSIAAEQIVLLQPAVGYPTGDSYILCDSCEAAMHAACVLDGALLHTCRCSAERVNVNEMEIASTQKQSQQKQFSLSATPHNHRSTLSAPLYSYGADRGSHLVPSSQLYAHIPRSDVPHQQVPPVPPKSPIAPHDVPSSGFLSPRSDASMTDGSTAASDEQIFGFDIIPSGTSGATNSSTFSSFFSNPASSVSDGGSSPSATAHDTTALNSEWTPSLTNRMRFTQQQGGQKAMSYVQAAIAPPQQKAAGDRASAASLDAKQHTQKKQMLLQSNYPNEQQRQELERPPAQHPVQRISQRSEQSSTGKVDQGARNVKAQGRKLSQKKKKRKGNRSTSTLRIRGLPFRASVQEVLGFFAGFGIIEESLRFGYNSSDSRPSGEAWIDFVDASEAKRAKEVLNHAYLKHRWLELSLYE